MKINIINCSLISLLLITTVFSQEGWFEQISGTTNDIFDVFCIDQNNCWVVGSAGTILKTTNGGTDWISVPSGTSNALYSVFFIDTEIGWSVGSNGTILKSNDGGISWISQISGTNGYLTSVQFIDQNTGWIAGDVVLKTTDGGINWVPQAVGPGNSIFFLDQNIGWLVGDHNIYKTTNCGINWDLQTIVSSVDLLLVQFIDQNFGWVGGYYPIPPPVPGTILVTTNGGTDWINPNSYYGRNLTSIYFTDQYTGWAVAIGMYEPGTIHKTTDGGISWNLQYSAFDSFTSVFFTNPNIGWTAGYSGTILKTINGGVPVELTSFTASILQNEKAVQINWSTATETNNSGFEIQRTSPLPSPYQGEGGEAGRGWEKIGFVPGFGTTTEPKSYSFTDENVTTGTYKYRLKQIDFDGSFEYSNEIEVDVDFTPKEFVLYQNYPNPFNPSTKISWQSPVGSWQTLKIYDILGNEVITLVDEYRAAGKYEIEFNLASGIRNPASGVYFYKLIAGEFTQTRKMIILR